MKKHFIYLALLPASLLVQSCGQQSNTPKVPEEVITAFHERFPEVKPTDWELEDENIWEAEFQMNGKKYAANFSLNGEWKATEHEIMVTEIPESVRSILYKHFFDLEIEEAEIVETAKGTAYELEVRTNEEKFEATIDSNGKLTTKLIDKEKEGDEE
ncbi:MAG: hypothetical protein CL843_10515 [Crocinitomicaceae bacterium]|nr:hypothetical protein [Crocinitomicaceae bacterium]|tara:strand:- start:291 stop:761 length:471 start_codon:yes stop_codon:yes gene_type:complete